MAEGFRLLYVESHADFRRSLVRLLHHHGVDVIECELAEEALTHLDDRVIDVVMTNLCIADLGGIDLLRIWRERRPGTPYILLSGTSGAGTIGKAMAAGAFAYLLKPPDV